LTRAELRARIARAEARRDALAVEYEALDFRARMDPDPDARAGFARERTAVSAAQREWDATLRNLETELDALRDRLRAPILAASEAHAKALDALLDATIAARRAGEAGIEAEIERIRKAWCAGLGPLCDGI
jgi:hypothetical protein